jgi:hypothetical protein
MIPKELVVNIINSWLYFQDINQKEQVAGNDQVLTNVTN